MAGPLLLASALPEVADARGVSIRQMELCFLAAMALATIMTVSVVGALLIFALVSVRAGIALSSRTNWPPGFYVGVIARPARV